MTLAGEERKGSDGGRIEALDVLRGLAIFGIFAVHVPIMGIDLARFVAAGDGRGSALDVAGHAVMTGLFELKFWAIFSLLFGAGLMLQSRRAQARGRPYGRVFLRRHLLLIAMGLAHGLLLFPFEVLFVYGTVALPFFVALGWSPRTKLWCAAGLLALFPAWNHALNEMDSHEPPGANYEDVREIEDWSVGQLLEALFGANEEQHAEVHEYVRREAGVGTVMRFRAANFAFWTVVCVFFFDVRVLALFFLGAALLELDFFTSRRKKWHRRLLLFGLTVALPLELLFACAGILGFAEDTRLLLESVHLVASAALAMGLVSGVLLACHAPARRWLETVKRHLAAVGRTALTNYVLQSVVLNVLFFSYGLDLYGRVGFAACAAIVVGVFVLQAVASAAWMRRFRMGPLEALWRRGTYGRA